MKLPRNLGGEELAALLGIPAAELNISALVERLDDQTAAALNQRKANLEKLTAKLQKQHRSTTMLLAECARFNRQLLEKIINVGSSQNITYGASGNTQRHNDNAFVNMQF